MMLRLFLIACLLCSGIVRAQNAGIFLSTYSAADHVLDADPNS